VAGTLLFLILFFQGIPTQQGGTVRGVLRDSGGSPLPGVRMAALARPDSLETIAEGTAMAGIAETDVYGRYALEDVPPGRYVIAAGRLDIQTYYPGTQDLAKARVIVITPGAVLTDIDFVLDHSSFGRAPEGFSLGRSNGVTIPMRVTVENGGKLPVSADGQFVVAHVESSSGADDTFPLDGSDLSVPVVGPTDVRVTVENLPDHYSVKSVTYGTTDVTRGTFRLTPGSLTPLSFTPLPIPTPRPLATPPSTVSITLTAKSAERKTGVRVTGSIDIRREHRTCGCLLNRRYHSRRNNRPTAFQRVPV